jgi:beta-carotene 3-hydroxylase
MEVVAYLTHRFVMHGRLGAWHASHHQARTRTFEANDLYPLVAAAVTISAMALGSLIEPLHALVWIGTGVTLYGVAYVLVHDIGIHGRVVGRSIRIAPLGRVREAHRIHHLWAGEPYGFLLPIVPRALRDRAADVSRDPLVH